MGLEITSADTASSEDFGECTESVAGGKTDGIRKMIVRRVDDTDAIMNDAPLGLKNRCRLIRLVKDIETLSRIEENEPTIMDEGVLMTSRTLSLMSIYDEM